MGIGIYLAADPDSAISTEGDHTNDFLITADGRRGTVSQKKLYIRNSDSALYYNNIALTTGSDALGNSYLDDSLGYSWKLSEGDTQPLDSEWLDISAQNTITFSDLGAEGDPETTTYLPFWVRVEVPKNIEVRTFTEIQFKLTATENLV